MQFVLSVLNFLFVVIGVTAFLRFVFNKITTFPTTEYHFLVILKKGSAEMALREVMEKSNMMLDKKEHRIYAIDAGLCNEDARVCEMIASQDSRVILCSKEELFEKIV